MSHPVAGGRQLPVAEPQTQSLRLDDGTLLVADIWRPAGPGRYPVMLMRQPYGRRIASTVVLSHPAWFAARGYVVVVQDVRGCGDSTGRFDPLANEAADGAATLSWAAEMPGSDGRVATYGFSYQAMTQYLALAGAGKAGTKRPDAMVPIMGGWGIADDWVCEGGAFRLTLNQYWLFQMAAGEARRAGEFDDYHVFAQAAEAGAHHGPRPAYGELLARAGRYVGHYEGWRAGDRTTFDAISPRVALLDDPLDIPALHVGGWLDFMLDGTLAADRAFRARGAAPQRLVVGPWPHLPWGRFAGSDLGEAAGLGIDIEIVDFLNFHMKGMGEPGPAYRLFDVGTGRWRDFATLDGNGGHKLFLGSGGRAAATTGDGRLLAEPGPAGMDILVHDPWRPAPAAGLHWDYPNSFCDRRTVDDRSDVAIYTTLPLATDICLAGPVAAEIHVDCDRPSHDLNCTLSALRPDGSAMALTGGHLRIDDATVSGPRRVPMRAICATLPAGSRLRLSIQAAAWPAFVVNPGTGKRPEEASRAEAQVTTLQLGHGRKRPSCIVLPLVSSP